jgi:hypothetical protein
MVYLRIGLNQKDKSPAAELLRKLAGGWGEKDAAGFLISI